jgi:bla regulator protein BlaR1
MMAISFMHALLIAVAASSLAVLLVVCLRKPLRIATGAQAAYWLWLLVPVSVLATRLPTPPHSWLLLNSALPGYANGALSFAAVAAGSSVSQLRYASVALIIWVGGVGAVFTLLLTQQLKFMRSLGEMSSDANGIWRSQSIVAPMLIVGAWRPRVVVPADFESRYSGEEQGLALAHEHAHLARGDILVTAFAAGCLCLSWFNPLMYWALGLLRLDQELACDALVLRRSGQSARFYADALLKTQLAVQSSWQVPVGCHWRSIHPLKERVAMLKRPLPGLLRRVSGTTAALALTLGGSYAAWAAASETQPAGPPILVHLKLTVADASNTFSQEIEFIVNSGESMNYKTGLPYDARCTAFLPNPPTGSWDMHPPGGAAVPASGQILVECLIRNNGEVVATPAVITLDGQPASIDFVNTQRGGRYTLELTATTSSETIAAKKKAAAEKAQANG